MQQISVEKALIHGRWLIIYIPVSLVMAMVGLFVFGQAGDKMDYQFSILLIALLAVFVIAYWTTISAYWMIWSFARVTNVHQLKRRARKEKLLSSDHNDLPRFALLSAAQRTEWARIEKRFLEEDVFYDDKSVPQQTLIFYSRKTAIFFLIFGILTVCFAALLIDIEGAKGFLMVITIGLFGLYLMWRACIKIFRKAPVLTLSSQGIAVLDSQLLPWNKVTDWQINYTSRNYYFDVNNGLHSIKINTLRISRRRLLYLLEIYQQRHENL
jgi:hypothetical protein